MFKVLRNHTASIDRTDLASQAENVLPEGAAWSVEEARTVAKRGLLHPWSISRSHLGLPGMGNPGVIDLATWVFSRVPLKFGWLWWLAFGFPFS